VKMVGIYHIALLPEADEAAFVTHMEGAEGVLQLTRVTSGFEPRLLRREATTDGLRGYAWHVSAQLVGDAGYSFAQNVPRLAAGIAPFGVVAGVDAYAVVAEPEG
jgi:hypothetical protein